MGHATDTSVYQPPEFMYVCTAEGVVGANLPVQNEGRDTELLSQALSETWQRLLPPSFPEALGLSLLRDVSMHVIVLCPQITSSDLLLSCAVCAAKTVAVLEDYPNKEGGRP